MITCLKNFLSENRRPDFKMVSTASIRLPYVVESRPERHFLAWKGSAQRIMYVILKTPAPVLSAEAVAPVFNEL